MTDIIVTVFEKYILPQNRSGKSIGRDPLGSESGWWSSRAGRGGVEGGSRDWAAGWVEEGYHWEVREVRRVDERVGGVGSRAEGGKELRGVQGWPLLVIIWGKDPQVSSVVILNTQVTLCASGLVL